MNRFLAVLMMAALFAPSVRWASSAPNLAACACPPSCCRCEGHDHMSGHGSACAMANGGKCAVESSDAWMAASVGKTLFVPVEPEFNFSLQSSRMASGYQADGRLPGYRHPPDHPPRHGR